MAAKAESLEQVLADEREDTQVLRRNGLAREADMVERVLDRIARAAEDYITWLPEERAALRSAHSVKWLRARFPEWLAEGHAKKEHGRRLYRACVIPQRAHASLAAQDGRDAAALERKIA